jgi:hypothetical protein
MVRDCGWQRSHCFPWAHFGEVLPLFGLAVVHRTESNLGSAWILFFLIGVMWLDWLDQRSRSYFSNWLILLKGAAGALGPS